MKPLAPFGFAPKPHPAMRAIGALVLALCASAAPALEGGFPPGAERTAQRFEALGSHALPIGPWADGAMLTQRVEGRVEQSAWRVPGAAAQGTLALLAPLRAALLAEGWQLLFECETLSCGGFDFRYSTQVLPEPAMHVDLGDFRFLSARRGQGAGREHLSLLVSRSAGAGTGHVQMIRVGPAGAAAPPAPAPLAPAVPVDAGGLAAALEGGSAVLDGVTFASGDAATVQGGDAALVALAAWLAANPDRTIALVGHTDASGSLESNVALSRKRAEAVRARLIADHGADGARITALGAGFMAPRGSNLTEEGRAKNRRVEAIVTSTR
jgi:OOP family OmpA-OmpF porin